MLLRPSTDMCPKELVRDMRGFFNSLLGDRVDKPVFQFFDCQALLLHAVALSQRHGVLLLGAIFPNGVKIHRDSEWCARFVLAAIAPADRPAVVVEDGKMRT